MKINKSIVCLIPARSGSKRIKNKNIKSFCGKPIIEWVIKNVKKINTIKQIILTTDSRRYANLVKKYNVKVPFLRPKKISNDIASDNDVIKHFLNFDKNYDKYKYILYIYPTAVLSTPSIIKKSFYEFKKKKCSKLYPVSIFSPPIQYALSLYKEKKIKSKYEKYIKINSKNVTKHYYDAGQFYWINVKEFLNKNKNKNEYGYIVDKHNAIDIDYIEDFKLAESIFRHRNRNDAKKR